MTPKITYHPILKWRCTRCKAHGEITHESGHACDVTWRQVIEAHQTASPQCASRGTGGIAVESDSGHLPEAS